MTAYLITYDLIQPGRNYLAVEQAIKECSFNGQIYCSPLKSVWLIKSALNANQITTRISHFIDLNDRFLVIEIAKNCNGCLDSQEYWKYIYNNILY